MTRRIFTMVLTFALAVLPSLAAADDAKERAKALFLQGREHYVAGRFGDALTAFEQANAIKPHPLMLFNIAQVYEAMDDLPSAIARYDEYLATGPGDADEVKAKVADLQARLATWAEVSLSSAPPGATVWVLSKDLPPRGQTPVTLRLPPAEVKLMFGLARHEPVERVVALQPKQKVELAVVMPPILPVLSVTTAPPGAQVSVGGQALPGVTPLNAGVPAGRQKVTVTLQGFEPVEREVVLDESHTAQQPFALDVQLEQAIPRGTLVVDVEPVGAEIRIDGELVGKAPLPGPLTLKQGLHRLEVAAPGADPYSEMVTIQAGAETETSVELDVPGAPGASSNLVSYIVMGSGGALLVGGGIAAILANSAHSDFEACGDDASCRRTQEEVDLAEDVRSKALAADVMLGVGAAVAATGVVLYLLNDDAPADASGGTGVMVAPAQGGLMGVGRFEF
ncbi:MAG: PEGA domain-containing protein [Myxococcales bacterium]|nr:PEGA domain-containing protein [Myxococcales bacterium]